MQRINTVLVIFLMYPFLFLYAEQPPSPAAPDTAAAQKLTVKIQGLYEALSKQSPGTLGYKTVRDVIREEQAKLDSLVDGIAVATDTAVPVPTQPAPPTATSSPGGSTAPAATAPTPRVEPASATPPPPRPAAMGTALLTPNPAEHVTTDLAANSNASPKAAALAEPVKPNQNEKKDECSQAEAACSAPCQYGNNDEKGACEKACNKAKDCRVDHNPQYITIGGLEWAGYSSQTQTTNGFLDLEYRGPLMGSGKKLFSGWGRIRLTSAPQTSTNGVVSTFQNPSGTLTTYDYSKVGEVLDYVAGPVWQFHKDWAFIASVGATTPLSSQNVAVTYAAPDPGTVECTTLVQRFPPGNGSPGLQMAPPGSATCLLGGYKSIAFSNQDRSNFLMKYSAGFRATYKDKCTPSEQSGCLQSTRALDVTLGQDASVTGGKLAGVVLKLDGTFPIPTGQGGSWLYLFGSAYMRLAKNQNLAPLILESASGVKVPSSTVIVLPLQQPNRDYYRLGVGLNINQLFCKAFGSGCTKEAEKTDSNAGQAQEGNKGKGKGKTG